ncbi:MAG: hypothetical protein K2N36_03860, partial [Ruminiclostridium sp.]|nr:hypothetical protein [Ruminiclostridium sp.]
MKKLPIIILPLLTAITLASCNSSGRPQISTSETAQAGQISDNITSTIVYEIPKYDSDHLISSLDEINKRLAELGKEYRVEFHKMGGPQTLYKLASSGEIDIVTVCG